MIGRRFGKPKMDMSHFQKFLLPVRDDNLYVEEAENGFIYRVSEKYKVRCLISGSLFIESVRNIR